MPDQSPPAAPHTFVLERHYPHAAQRVFTLLADPAKKRLWMFEDDGTTIDAFEMDFRVGGSERVQYSISKGSPVDGLPFVNEGMFLDIVPDRRVVFAYYMSIGGRRISSSQVTFELTDTPTGSTLTLLHQAVFFEGADGPEMRKHGWEVLLDKLGTSAASDSAQ